MKTPEELTALKESWLDDPHWNIEDTPGFEDHVEELAEFHTSYKEKRHAEYRQMIREWAEKVISDPEKFAEYLYYQHMRLERLEEEVSTLAGKRV